MNAMDDQTMATQEDHSSCLQGDAAWKILVVDDDPDVVAITKIVLGDFTFKDRSLDILTAYSGAEAREVLSSHPDVAAVLLDVVMETDDAGLQVVDYIRNELDNSKVRIVLRTGQPGSAPEHEVIRRYDINDYKEKTELTAQKLHTLVYTTLRSFADIDTIDRSKHGLERVIQASASLFQEDSLKDFAQGVLDQLASLVGGDVNAVMCKKDGIAALTDRGRTEVLAATGCHVGKVGGSGDGLPDDVWNLINQSRARGEEVLQDGCFAGSFTSRTGAENALHMTGLQAAREMDKVMISLFAKNVGIAFDNLHLQNELEHTQREIVYLLGEAVETRSRETGNHVKRVAETSKLLGKAYGLSDEEAEVIRFAAPLHDLGKIGIPDAILNKPGRHTDEERVIMKTHAQIGWEMLRRSNRQILRAGALIARDHHERWDGQGYPNERAGEEIHLYGRIVAVADVFDALGSDRCYKKAWPLEDVKDFLQSERGQQFEPRLIDLLFDNMDKVECIQKAFQDETGLAA